MGIFDGNGTGDDRTQPHQEGVQTHSLKLELFAEVEYDEEGTETGRSYDARYVLMPADADGRAVPQDERQGDALPHLTATEKTHLRDMMDQKVDDANTALSGG